MGFMHQNTIWETCGGLLMSLPKLKAEECRGLAGQALPDDRIAAEIGVFFTGGFETTGHTIAWAL